MSASELAGIINKNSLWLYMLTLLNFVMIFRLAGHSSKVLKILSCAPSYGQFALYGKLVTSLSISRSLKIVALDVAMNSLLLVIMIVLLGMMSRHMQITGSGEELVNAIDLHSVYAVAIFLISVTTLISHFLLYAARWWINESIVKGIDYLYFVFIILSLVKVIGWLRED